MIEVRRMTPQIPSRPQTVRPDRSPKRSGVLFLFGILFLITAAGQAAHAQDSSSQELPSTLAAMAIEPVAVAPQSSHRPSNSDIVAHWYGPNYRTPFVLEPDSAHAADIERNAIEYTHLGFWALGSNFADVMVSKSSMDEPASGGGSGATEAYLILRSNIGLNEATGTNAFRKGPMRNLSIELGANLETKNSSFAPAEKTIYFGPNLQFAVPRGYFNVGLHLRKEWNHEGVLGKSEDYDPDFSIEPTWMFPFTIGAVHLAYTGFADYNTQKGDDSFGNQTVGEFLLRNAVTVDVGAMLFKRAQLLDVSGGFWYWHNEYGKPSSDPGAEQMTPMIGLAFHLDGGRANHTR
jgi:hypothetical protein